MLESRAYGVLSFADHSHFYFPFLHVDQIFHSDCKRKHIHRAVSTFSLDVVLYDSIGALRSVGSELSWWATKASSLSNGGYHTL